MKEIDYIKMTMSRETMNTIMQCLEDKLDTLIDNLDADDTIQIRETYFACKEFSLLYNNNS